MSKTCSAEEAEMKFVGLTPMEPVWQCLFLVQKLNHRVCFWSSQHSTRKVSGGGKKRIKCQVHISIEHTTAADLLWASSYSSTSIEALEKQCSLDWQIDHRRCNKNTSVTAALEESLLVWHHWQWAAQPRGDPWTAIDFASWLVLHLNNSDPKTIITEGLFLPALPTKSMLKACCLSFLVWQKVLACLSCWTSSEVWHCGQYLLSWVLSLLTTEGEESSWVAHYPATKSTAFAVVGIRIHMKCWKACRHAKERILTKNRYALLLVVESIGYLPGWQKHGLLTTWSQREYEVCVAEIKWVSYSLAMQHRQFLLPVRRERPVHKISGSVRSSVLLWMRGAFPL